MAKVFADRVLEASTSSGTGPFALTGAVQGYRRFSSAFTVGDQVDYTIQGVDGDGRPTANWETGVGVYSSANTLTRTTVIASSNGNAAVNFPVGLTQVYNTLGASTIEALTSGGAALPPGGDAGQVLGKVSADDGDVDWIDAGGAAVAVTPTHVQSAAIVANASGTVTLPFAPTAGNLLIAMGLHWNANPGVSNGYAMVLSTNGVARDGLFVAYKVAGSGETAAQTPFSYGPNGGQVGIIEIANANGLPAVLASFQESAADPLTLSGTGGDNSLLVGMFGLAQSNFDFPVTGATKRATAAGTTNSNSPRRLTLFTENGSASPTAVSADLDAAHDSGGVLVRIAGSNGGGGTGITYANFQDRKASGTGGGSANSPGGWRTRDINTIKTNTIPGASLAGNQITLPPGDYSVSALTSCYRTQQTRARLRDITHGITIVDGANIMSWPSDTIQMNCHVEGFFTLLEPAIIELQIYYVVAYSGGDGLGVQVSDGSEELYSNLMFMKFG